MAKPQTQTSSSLDEMRVLLARMQEEQRQRLAETDAELKQREHGILRLQELISDMESPSAPLHSVAGSPSLALVATKPRAKKPRPHPDSLKHKHPFPRAVGNVRAWAHAAGFSYTYVKGWFSTGKYQRPIPAKFALRLLKTHKVPLEAWKNGISTETPRPRDAG